MNEQSEGPARLKVIVADDQAAVREPLAAVLGLAEDIDVVAAAADGTEVLAAVAAGPVDVVLMDLRMPVLDGIETTRRLTEEHPEVAVVVLTTFADDESILGALGAGARGYLTKNAGRQDITRAIRRGRGPVRTRPGGPEPPARHGQDEGGARPGRRGPSAAAGRPHTPRARGPRPDRPGPVQPGHRGETLHQRGHGQDPHQQPVRQGPHPRPRGRGPPRHRGGTGLRNNRLAVDEALVRPV